jgi:hypothetical protein
MWPFKKNKYKELTRDQVNDAIIELEKRREEIEEDILVNEQKMQDSIIQGKKAKDLNEKKMYSRRVRNLQKTNARKHKQIKLLEKKVGVLDRVKYVIDGKEFLQNSANSEIDFIFNDPEGLHEFMSETIGELDEMDQELDATLEMMDDLLDEEYEDDMSEDEEEILAVMMEDDDDSLAPEESESPEQEEEKEIV